MIKKILIVLMFAMFLPVGGTVWGSPISVKISPTPMIKGEAARLELLHKGRGIPALSKQPNIPGIIFLRQNARSGYEMINGDITYSTSYAIAATRVGKIAIPALDIKVGNKQFKSKPFTALVMKNRSGHGTTKRDLEKMVFGKIKVLGKKKAYYVGEEIPVELNYYNTRGLKLNRIWPQLRLPNIVFKNFADVNKDNPDFAGYKSKNVEYQGEPYELVTFRTAFRVIKPGVLRGEAVADWSILFPARQRSGYSSLFFRKRYEEMPRKIITPFPELTIKPLPPVPSDCKFLGLVGDWKVNVDFSTSEFKVGDPFTMTIKLTGQGTLETLRAPKLKVPGFRFVYKPEIDKKASAYGGKAREKAEIKYVMVPLEHGPIKIDFALATFACKQGRYHETAVNKTIKVQQSDDPGALANVYAQAQKERQKSTRQQAKPQNRIGEIFYLKKEISNEVKLPLWRNELIWYILLGLLGPFVLAFVELRNFWRKRLEDDPLLSRRKAAYSRRGKVIKALTRCDDEKVNDIAQAEVIPFINDVMGQPPGTSASELAETVEDEELAECLKEVSDSHFMPGDFRAQTTIIRQHLIKAVKKISCLLLLLGLTGTLQAQTNGLVTKKIETAEQAEREYREGNFSSAAAYYKKQIDPDQPSPNALYNLGNCFYQMGDLPRALVAYERAFRLKPGDTDILENINLTRRKLFLPQIRQSEHPYDLLLNLRDNLRPDQWLLGVFICWSIAFLAIAGRHLILANRRWLYILGIALFVGMVCILAVITQRYSTYSTKSAIVVVNNTPVYSLPTLKNGRVIFKFKAGEAVQVEEQDKEWCRVRDSQAEGWIHTKAISRLWEHLK